jgi:beta-1,4-mannosyltransferase
MKPRLDRLIFVPDHETDERRPNSYGYQMLEAWRRAGFEPTGPAPGSLREWLTALRARRRTVAVVNWLEGVLVDRHGRIGFTRRLRYYRKLAKLRLLAARLVYVQHNRHPHHTRPDDVASVERTVERGLSCFADVLLSHDLEHAGSPARHLPHPAYPVHPQAPRAPQRRVVCFGRIGPYKALDRLVQQWSADRPLLIAGQVQDADYLEQLRTLACGRPVQFHTEPMSDDAAAALLADSSAAIVAHSPPSMVVSGSLYFALSCGVPVVAVGLPHARRLRDAGHPGVHWIESLEALASVDWDALAREDRGLIRARTLERFGLDAIAALLPRLIDA